MFGDFNFQLRVLQVNLRSKVCRFLSLFKNLAGKNPYSKIASYEQICTCASFWLHFKFDPSVRNRIDLGCCTDSTYSQ